MDSSQWEILRQAWLEGKDGCLPAREQAKAWALREVWKEDGKGEHGMKTYLLPSWGNQVEVRQVRRPLVSFLRVWKLIRIGFSVKGSYEDMGAPAAMTGQQRAAMAR